MQAEGLWSANCSVFAACVGLARLAQAPLRLLLAHPPRLCPLDMRPPGRRRAPAAWVPASQNQDAFGAMAWRSGAPWAWWQQRGLHGLRGWKCISLSGLGVLRIPAGNLQGWGALLSSQARTWVCVCLGPCTCFTPWC